MPSEELVKTKDTQTRAILQIPLNTALATLWKNAFVCLQLLRLISLLTDASNELKSEEFICLLKVQYLVACQEMTKSVQSHCHMLLLRCMEFLTLLDKRPDAGYLYDWLKGKDVHTSHGELSTGMLDSGVCDKDSNYDDMFLSSDVLAEEISTEGDPAEQKNRSHFSHSLDTLLCYSTRDGLILPEFAQNDSFTCGPRSFYSSSHNFSSRRILSSPQLNRHWQSFSTNLSNTTINGRIQSPVIFDDSPHQSPNKQSHISKRTLLPNFPLLYSDYLLPPLTVPQFAYIPTPSYASYALHQNTRNEDFAPIKGSLAVYEESLLNFNHRQSTNATKRKPSSGVKGAPLSGDGPTTAISEPINVSFTQIVLPHCHTLCLLLTSWIIICIFSFWVCLFIAISYHRPFGVPF
jgi:hypothetical protein